MIQILLISGGVIVALFLLTVFVGAPYVPSKRRDVARAFDELYSIGEGDTLVDIGSGDGVVLREAAKRGARAIGYEINPALVAVSWLLCHKDPSIKTHMANFWRAKVPETTTIVYTFGESRDIERMARWVETQATRLGKPLYFLSYAFQLKDRAPLRISNQYALYEIQPLQGE